MPDCKRIKSRKLSQLENLQWNQYLVRFATRWENSSRFLDPQNHVRARISRQ